MEHTVDLSIQNMISLPPESVNSEKVHQVWQNSDPPHCLRMLILLNTRGIKTTMKLHLW